MFFQRLLFLSLKIAFIFSMFYIQFYFSCSSIDFTETILTLTVDSSIVDDSATYTIRITNEFGDCTCSADIIIIFESPTFTKPLGDINITLTDTATLECTFTGIPEPEPKWFISGVDAWESEKYHVERHEMTTSLTVTNVNMDDVEMDYLCKITNPVGEAKTTAKLLPQGLSRIFLLASILLYVYVHRSFALFLAPAVLAVHSQMALLIRVSELSR
jgi:hypothetical protein